MVDNDIEQAIIRSGLLASLQECNDGETNIKNSLNFKMIKSVCVRLLKGAIAGATASMAVVTIQQPAIWGDFVLILNSLGLACGYGAITGVILALQKWASWKE